MCLIFTINDTLGIQLCLPLSAAYISVYMPASPPAASTKMFGSIHGTQEWVGMCYKFIIIDKLVIKSALR
jgi:hypothetical protein